MTHMILKGVFSVLYLGCTGCPRMRPLDWKVLRIASFIGVLVGLDVVASNLSFQYITVTFYVMVKSSSLIWILVFGALAKVEPCSPQIATCVLVIAAGIFLSTCGEADFNATGFTLVLASEIFAAARWVGTQALMTDRELDTVTAVLYMSPGSTLSLLPLVLAREHEEMVILLEGGRQTLIYALLVIVPGFLAFVLLIIEVKLVQETSSLTLAVLGNLKSVTTILFAILVFRESATLLQWCGVMVGTAGMLCYSYFKKGKNAIQDCDAGFAKVPQASEPKHEVMPHAQSDEIRGKMSKLSSKDMPCPLFLACMR
eukprot:CAMPEP_0203911408 /NCGR_PEP_ID=MMETSP0359-20131031/52574_1 /ASSEMBLY_ACC=CAM_ASM_000338 /TAXON_ID=268821 /ORGANISM="Scrippsiella Hangoei, Strain SHTV-5" /LENGTH=313 /DNA_ID=CAMNT_0050837107 /DNA_START=283 /DNA_END=1224 /DNA_ORIENTATION=+